MANLDLNMLTKSKTRLQGHSYHSLENYPVAY